MTAANQIEVADRRPYGDRQRVALFWRCLLQIGFHVHAKDFTKKINQSQALFIFLVVYLNDKNKDDAQMTREEIRRENARKLAGGKGGKAAFARLVQMEASQVSQLIGPNPLKNIGNSIARRIEQAHDLPEGWLDVPHYEIGAAPDAEGSDAGDDQLPSLQEDLPAYGDSSTLTDQELQRLMPGAMRVRAAGEDDPALTLIPKVRLRLSAGINGFELEPERYDGSTTAVPTHWIERNNFYRDNLIAIRVKGESMEPTLYEDDLVVINIADKKMVDGHVYAFNYEGEPVVKRLERDGGQWWLKSDNQDQRKYGRKMCRGEACIIIGRVVRKESERL